MEERPSKNKQIERDFTLRSEFDSFFKELTSFEPFKYQIKTAERVFSQENVILNAPTGAGKTYAAIMPFVFAKKKKLDFPTKLVYSLPLRTLANSLYEDIANNKVIKGLGLKVSLQTGEYPEDSFFESDIVFTTIDQTLSSILGFPYSVPQKLANINAGALLGSYLVFDEFHLLDPEKSMATSLNILKKLNGISQYCLMTATISEKTIDKINDFLGTKSVMLSKSELSSLKNYNNQKIINVSDFALNIDKILKNHHKKTIVTCNTVERSQEVYLKLKKRIGKDTELICINSRFFKKDRQDKEKKILEFFGKNGDHNKKAILVATQIVEVGLDISCDVLHTEISPINSFLQRIGRCARFEGENGIVFVYNVQENGSRPYLPYNSEYCKKTFLELKSFNGKNLSYFDGTKIVNSVLTDKELKEIELTWSFDPDRLVKSWNENDKRTGRELIRDVNAVNVVILQNDDSLHSMYDYESISINPHVLVGKLKKIDENIKRNFSEDSKLVSIIEENNILSDFEMSDYVLRELETLEEIFDHPTVILNPKYVKYSTEIGLNFLGEGDYRISDITDKKNGNFIDGYQKDTYEEHIEAMIDIYNDLKYQFEYPLRKLCKKLNLEINIDELVKLIIILHDYGKLNKKWQQIISDFQRRKGNFFEGEFLAHSDFKRGDYLSQRLPSHAGVGAILIWSLLDDTIEDEEVVKAISSSIIKHHSVKTYRTPSYDISKEARDLVISLINRYCPSIKLNFGNDFLLNYSETNFEPYILNFRFIEESFLYAILVRILRLADQKSCDKKSYDSNVMGKKYISD